MKNSRHQTIPEPHDDGAEKKCQSGKPDNSQGDPAASASVSAIAGLSFGSIHCCFHDFYF
jgi:hypothetical protein